MPSSPTFRLRDPGPPEPPYDHEIEWEGEPERHELPLPVCTLERFYYPTGRLDGRELVIAVRPEYGGPWLAGTPADQLTVIESPDDWFDGDDVIELRFGWGEPGCVERMPEFDGF